MEKWPVLPPCIRCPWRERLFSRRSFAGFYVRANASSFTWHHDLHSSSTSDDGSTSSQSQLFPGAEIATIYPIRPHHPQLLQTAEPMKSVATPTGDHGTEGIPSSSTPLISFADHFHTSVSATDAIRTIDGMLSYCCSI